MSHTLSFRAVPAKPNVFHVQEKRRFLPGWKTAKRHVYAYGECVSFPVEFATQRGALDWIDEEVMRRRREKQHLATPPYITYYAGV